MAENIQSRLFNGTLGWNSNEIAWSHLYEAPSEPEPSLPVLELLINDGQLELWDES